MAGPIDELLSTTLKNWVEDNAIDNIFKTPRGSCRVALDA